MTEWVLSKFTYQSHGPETVSCLLFQMFQCALLRFPTHVHILWRKQHYYINMPMYSHIFKKCSLQKIMKTINGSYPETDSAWSARLLLVGWKVQARKRKQLKAGKTESIVLLWNYLIRGTWLFARKRDFVNVSRIQGKKKEERTRKLSNFFLINGSQSWLCATWVCSAIWREDVSKHQNANSFDKKSAFALLQIHHK